MDSQKLEKEADQLLSGQYKNGEYPVLSPRMMRWRQLHEIAYTNLDYLYHVKGYPKVG